MTLEIVSFILGGLLVLIGIIGGGLEVRELKIPNVKWTTRIFSIIGGLFFISLGIGIQSEVPKVVNNQTKSSTNPVSFTIYDQLGYKQISEQITVIINGKVVGTLTVNQHYPTSAITVTVPQEGQYSFTAKAKSVVNIRGKLTEVTGAGQGMINVTSGKVFSIADSVSGNTWFISLIDKSP